jgi:hypothetical protein
MFYARHCSNPGESSCEQTDKVLFSEFKYNLEEAIDKHKLSYNKGKSIMYHSAPYIMILAMTEIRSTLRIIS